MNKILAIVVIRFKLLARSMRGKSRVVNMLSGLALWAVGGLVCIGLAAGFGAMTLALIGADDPRRLGIGFTLVFYTCAFFAFVLPLLRGAMAEGFDASPFLVFPISRPRLYLITLGACLGSSEHLLYLPTLAVVAAIALLATGMNPILGLTLVLLLLVFFIAWSNLVTLFMVSVMRTRRIREIVGIVGFLALIGLSVTPALIDQASGGPETFLPVAKEILQPLAWVFVASPPSLAAGGLAGLAGAAGGMPLALWSLLGLLAWDALGLGLGYYIFANHHLGERSPRSRRRSRPAKAVARTEGSDLLSFDNRLFRWLPDEVRAVAAKDLHYLLRSLVGRFNLFMAPAFVALLSIFVGDLIDKPMFGLEPDRLVLFGMLFYAVLFSTNFVNNALAWETGGIAAYYMAPVSLQRVMAGKNLAVFLYNGLLYFLMIVAWSILQGVPDASTLLSTLLMYAAAILFFTSWGNVVSVLFPLQRDMSRMVSSPSQVATLLSIVCLALSLLLIGPFLSIPILLGWTWLQPLAMLVLLAGLSGIHLVSLNMTARLLDERRERILEALKSAR